MPKQNNADQEPIDPLVKAYIDEQIQKSVDEQPAAHKKRWKNAWRSASPITKASFAMTVVIAFSTVAYAISAWRQLNTMQAISADNTRQTQQLIEAANQIKIAAWEFKGSAQGIDGNLGNAVGRLSDQAVQLANNVTQTGRLASDAEKANGNATKALEIQRPWIAAPESIKPPVGEEWSLTLNNFGQSPAIVLTPNVVFWPIGKGRINEWGYLEDFPDLCTTKRGNLKVPVFQKIPQDVPIKPRLANSWVQNQQYPPNILDGCVVYYSPMGGGPYTTRFVYWLTYFPGSDKIKSIDRYDQAIQ